ncbi:MAG: GNAT family N-acetyltransferase [Actinomycetota bacterium]
MTEFARTAEAADDGQILAVLDAVHPEILGGRGGPLLLNREAAVSDWTARLAAAHAADDQHLIVGGFADVVFGAALVSVEPLADGSLIGVLDVLAVDPEAREVGIGEAMMNMVIERVKAAGCVGVDSRALPGDRETKNFFESFGLKARLLTVHMAFDPAENAPRS